MPDRVLSTAEGKSAISRMQQIINGGLTEQITSLINEGNTLMEPAVWDGQLATTFRGNWPGTANGLTATRDKLEELRTEVEKINVNIMTAGGNA